MRVLRDRRWKLIWNLVHGLPYPFASDFWASETWRATVRDDLAVYGRRAVQSYLRRPRFELYDLASDPHETANLAGDAAHGRRLEDRQARLRARQERTGDPWIVKWTYE